jgi:hypothetical protein
MGRLMAKAKKVRWYIPGLLAFVAFVFITPAPIPMETVLKPVWITSLGSNNPIFLGADSQRPKNNEALLPFILGNRFGYVGEDGNFGINQIRNGYISLSDDHWAEYESTPSIIQVMNPMNETVFSIEAPRGYPMFLDNRVFIVGSEQNFISAINDRGEKLWTYDFSSPVTCVDAAGRYLLTGTLDGEVILLNSSGVPAFAPFEPGGSRLSVILGCAISKDASRFALVSGIDEQRFLYLERSGDTYKVIYHEFLGSGFRRPVHIGFIDNDSKIVFEREGGLGIYSIGGRGSVSIAMEGEIAALDDSGDDGFLFVITSQGPDEKRLISIRYPGIIVNEAPFRSGSVFLLRRNKRLYLGGDLSMAAFELERR